MKWLDAARAHLGLVAKSFATWVAVIGGALGERLDAAQTAAFRTVFNRDPLTAPCRELWLEVGRRGGKDFVASRLAIYLALFHRWSLAPGEVGVVIVLARDRAQAKVAFNYVRGALEATPELWAEVAAITADTITLLNGIEIQVVTADYGAVRGRTVIAAICDEFAFWPHEQATEVMRALRPAMATQPQAMLIIISSTYASFGPLYEARRKYYGNDDPRVLFGVATTRQMNPTVSEDFIKAELERDYAGASAEYLSIPRTDTTNFLDAALLDQATRRSPLVIPFSAMTPTGGHRTYYSGGDVSGGKGDGMGAVITFRDNERLIVAAQFHRPAPHDPLQVAHEVAPFLAAYGLSHMLCDNYAAGFSQSAYREAGVELSPSPVTRSEAYMHLLPLFTTGRIEIPDDKTLRAELLGLERRTSASGKDTVDHAPYSHDDLANSLALSAYAATRPNAIAGDTKVFAIPSTSADEYGAATGDWTWVANRSGYKSFDF